MFKTRVAGIILINNGIALMYREGVEERDYKEYYTLPGGGLEENETVEECLLREIEEELGIKVKPIKRLYEYYSEKFKRNEIIFLCKYISGKFGTGKGPEFSGDPKYKSSGKYIPKIVNKEQLEEVFLLPIEIKEKLIKDLKNNKIQID